MKKYVLCRKDKCFETIAKLTLFLLIALGSVYTLVTIGIVFVKWIRDEDFTSDLLVLPVFAAVAAVCAVAWRWYYGPTKIKRTR